MKIFFAAILILSCSISYSAGFMDGYELQKYAKGWEISSPDIGSDVYIGYIMGVVDSMGGVVFVLPDNVKAGQLAAIVNKYLKEHPEEWNETASVIVARSFRNAFPELNPPIKLPLKTK